jgi:hypothetical protein
MTGEVKAVMVSFSLRDYKMPLWGRYTKQRLERKVEDNQMIGGIKEKGDPHRGNSMWNGSEKYKLWHIK